jgi:hypothetical protein
MDGELSLIKAEFEKAARIPEEEPKWGTPPVTDLPGEARPEGLDDNQPVGDDAQNTSALKNRFNFAEASQADSKAVLRKNLAHFDDNSRSSSSQLIKNQPKTNSNVMSAVREALSSKLL